MSVSPDALDAEHRVVVNHEEQYSLWPTYRELPHGWVEFDHPRARGSREECLALIEQTWTDIRPRSLRQRMDGAADPDSQADL